MIQTARRTCALCGGRDAATVTRVDGRLTPACVVCLSPPPQITRGVLRPHRAVQLVRAISGLTSSEIAEHLGCNDEHGRARIYSVLARAVAAGAITRDDGRASAKHGGTCRYYPC